MQQSRPAWEPIALPCDLEELSRDWDKAYCMLKDLKIRYEAAIGEFPRREAIVLLGEKQESELGCRANLSAAVS